MDLRGNTYWEFRDKRSAELGRARRLVKYPRSTHYGDVTVSPAWHQWLRHTRDEPPSVDEQKLDVLRQERMKVLAAKADERWAAKPRVMDGPEMQQAVPGLRSPRKDETSRVPGTLAEDVRETLDTKNPKTEMVWGVEDTTATTRSQEAVGGNKQSWDALKEDEKKRAAGQTKGLDPWKRARGPSEAWQPEAWQPPATPKR